MDQNSIRFCIFAADLLKTIVLINHDRYVQIQIPLPSKRAAGGRWSPLVVFLCLYLITSLLINDFYKVPITVAFLLSSCHAIAAYACGTEAGTTYLISSPSAPKQEHIADDMDICPRLLSVCAKRQTDGSHRRHHLTLHILPDNLLLAGILSACFISLSIGTSVTICPDPAVDWQRKPVLTRLYGDSHVVGGSFFGDNLSFISDTTIASTKTQDCVMRDKFKINFMIVVPAHSSYWASVIQGLSLSAVPQIYED